MKIKLVAFGIARDILASSEKSLDIEGITSVGELKEHLCSEYEAFKALRSFSMAVNEEYQDDQFNLKEGDEVVIIPPVSGG